MIEAVGADASRSASTAPSIDVSFAVARGGWLMLIGPNGAGKSTALRALAGLVPYDGSLTIEGQRAHGHPRARARPARRAMCRRARNSRRR